MTTMAMMPGGRKPGPLDRDVLEAMLNIYRDFAIHFAQWRMSDPDAFVPPEDGDWMRSSLNECLKFEERYGAKDRADKLRAALWEPIFYQNHYHCTCGASWIDEHSCACDDECPSCGNEMSPETSLRIDTKEIGNNG